jgi:hypothetical protein
VSDLTRAEVVELEAARDHLYALRNWPEARIKWISAIRSGHHVLGMAPQIAHDKLVARDRIYERARQTIAALNLPVRQPKSKR